MPMEALQQSHLGGDHARWGRVTTAMCYGPGEQAMPYGGNGGPGSCWEGSIKLGPQRGDGGAGTGSASSQGSEEGQVWVILGEKEEVEEAERKGFKEKKTATEVRYLV